MSETHTNICANPRQPETDRSPRQPSQFAAAAVGILMVAGLTLTGCGDDKPKPIPKTSATPSVSPAPSAPALNAEQEADYNAAVQKYAEYVALVDRVGMDPKVTDELAAELVQLATKPVTDEFSDGLDELIRNDAHTEGHRKVEWSSAVSVKDNKIVLLQCKSPGTWVLVGKGKRVPQKSNTITKVSAIEFKGEWYIKDTDGAGKC